MLKPINAKYFDYLVYRLLKAAAGFVSSDTPLHPDTPQKRVHLVHCLIQLICRCSFEKDLDEKILGPVVVNLMTEVEMVVGTGKMARRIVMIQIPNFIIIANKNVYH